ncbi:MAG: GNAT family N-acetyltransferase [Subdoligranulum sp.]|nr:GNAT family N-acetyltransferase [Subdoligranulum sp.]
MNLALVRPAEAYKEQLFDMLTEWKNDIIENHTNTSPWAIWANDFHDFEHYMENLDTKEPAPNGKVPDTTLFCLDKDRNIFVGAVNIRHRLNEKLLRTGGHIGDGIRPSERRKGYATAMIALALDECRKLGIDRVLMCCDKENIGSAKSIVRNGGVLENEVEENGRIEQRYWIQL